MDALNSRILIILLLQFTVSQREVSEVVAPHRRRSPAQFRGPLYRGGHGCGRAFRFRYRNHAARHSMDCELRRYAFTKIIFMPLTFFAGVADVAEHWLSSCRTLGCDSTVGIDRKSDDTFLIVLVERLSPLTLRRRASIASSSPVPTTVPFVFFPEIVITASPPGLLFVMEAAATLRGLPFTTTTACEGICNTYALITTNTEQRKQ